MFGLAQRARVSARPAPAKVAAVLDRHEVAAAAVQATRPTLVPRTGVDAAIAKEKTARAEEAAVTAKIAVASGRISELTIERNRRQSGVRRWLPFRDNDVAIEMLKAERESLRSSAAMLAQARLRAEIEVRDARIAHVRAIAQVARDRDAALKAATLRQAIVARARRLLAAVPALAYVGAKRLLGMATRVERAREHGYDPGPTHRL